MVEKRFMLGKEYGTLLLLPCVGFLGLVAAVVEVMVVALLVGCGGGGGSEGEMTVVGFVEGTVVT